LRLFHESGGKKGDTSALLLDGQKHIQSTGGDVTLTADDAADSDNA
jgi:hypothetical protein